MRDIGIAQVKRLKKRFRLLFSLSLGRSVFHSDFPINSSYISLTQNSELSCHEISKITKWKTRNHNIFSLFFFFLFKEKWLSQFFVKCPISTVLKTFFISNIKLLYYVFHTSKPLFESKKKEIKKQKINIKNIHSHLLWSIKIQSSIFTTWT